MFNSRSSQDQTIAGNKHQLPVTEIVSDSTTISLSKIITAKCHIFFRKPPNITRFKVQTQASLDYPTVDLTTYGQFNYLLQMKEKQLVQKHTVTDIVQVAA